MRKNMLNNKFYKYGEKIVYLEYNCVERYLTVEADLGFIFLYISKSTAFSNG